MNWQFGFCGEIEWELLKFSTTFSDIKWSIMQQYQFNSGFDFNFNFLAPNNLITNINRIRKISEEKWIIQDMETWTVWKFQRPKHQNQLTQESKTVGCIHTIYFHHKFYHFLAQIPKNIQKKTEMDNQNRDHKTHCLIAVHQSVLTWWCQMKLAMLPRGTSQC